MFWNDIAEIKEWMNRLTERLIRIDHNVESVLGIIQENKSYQDHLGRDMGEVVKDSLMDIIESEDEYNSINRIHDKLNALVDDVDRQRQVLLAEKTLDKFEDYMKNVDKLNGMINEFKVCVSMARGALEERKKASEQEAKTAVLADMTKEIYHAMCAFIDASNRIEQKAHFKIDAIYKAVCESGEKKVPKKGKLIKRKGGRKRTVEVLHDLESE